MPNQTILVVEDDKAICQGIVDALQFHGYQVRHTSDGNDGLRKAISVDYDLLLLDLALPGTPGMEILKQVRLTRPTQPVIVLTAKGDESDRVNGLRMGADDYVVKPFSVKELIARVEAVLRRSAERPSHFQNVIFPGGVADFERREIRFEDRQRVELSEREADLFRYLVSNRGRAISREELLASVWRINPSGVATRTIDMHVARLREKLRDDSTPPQVLLTVRGKGYMFLASPDEQVNS